ncbi:LRP2 [Branchiostoma lanceolatum]|uniref:LRP2 protein n=1 Tax=Branchiostoma lanceolatum TaxID=7740 RepID=A0A8J9Z656_BRALA|nr:LRP2 [Branchiostoma lanceolatum]
MVQVHPSPSPDLSPNNPTEGMARHGEMELKPQNDEKREEVGNPDVEGQCSPRCYPRTKKQRIIVGVVVPVAVIAVITAASLLIVFLPDDPPSNGTALSIVGSWSDGTTAHLPVNLPSTSTMVYPSSSPRPKSTTIHPGNNPQPVSTTSSTTSEAETTVPQQSSTKAITTSRTTTTAFTTTTPGKSCIDQALFGCNDGQCIPLALVCDRHNDCGPGGGDEDNCPVTTCGVNQFTCNDGTCIQWNWRCDGKEECPNKDDESGCPSVGPSTAVP